MSTPPCRVNCLCLEVPGGAAGTIARTLMYGHAQLADVGNPQLTSASALAADVPARTYTKAPRFTPRWPPTIEACRSERRGHRRGTPRHGAIFLSPRRTIAQGARSLRSVARSDTDIAAPNFCIRPAKKKPRTGKRGAKPARGDGGLPARLTNDSKTWNWRIRSSQTPGPVHLPTATGAVFCPPFEIGY